jgi:hypothetical protein
MGLAVAAARWQVVCVLGLLAWLGAGCSKSNIPNTDVEDTSENRKVIAFVEEYRRALEKRDVTTLLGMASESYYDDNGTPSGTDDVDYKSLAVMLKKIRDSVLDIRYEMKYRRIYFRKGRVLVDYTYTGSFKIVTPDGERWTRKIGDNRIVLERRGETFRIISGM